MPKADVETITGVLVLTGIFCCVVSLLVLHLLPTGLSPLRNAVSQYGITRYRAGYRAQTVSMGVAAIAAAIGIGQLGVMGASIVSGLLVVCGVARLLIGWSPMDLPGTEPTTTGRRHGLLALAAFLAVTLAAIRLGGGLRTSVSWHGASMLILALGFEMLACLLAMGPVRRHETLRRYFGLVERAFYGGALAFFVVVGIELCSR